MILKMPSSVAINMHDSILKVSGLTMNASVVISHAIACGSP